jgi:hypothetical protein
MGHAGLGTLQYGGWGKSATPPPPLDFQGPPLPMTNAPHNEVARLKANKYREILYTQHVP